MDFKDIRLLAQPSRVNSRSECDTSTEICGINFDVPVIAPPMTSLFTPELLGNLNNARVGAIQPRKDTPNFTEHVFNASRVFINSSIDSAMATATRLIMEQRAGYALNTILSIEVNNGYMYRLADKIKEVKDIFPDLPIFAGAVFTPEGVEFLGKAGADVVLVGVGVSEICTTSLVTGIGMPIVETLLACGNLNYRIGVLGGIRNIGDVAKAIVLGADIIYIGHLLKGCRDAASKSEYWGMASKTEKKTNTYIEGQTLHIEPQEYYSSEIVGQIKQGLQSAMSFNDSISLQEFKNKCNFTIIR
jgi:hypothetical protein